MIEHLQHHGVKHFADFAKTQTDRCLPGKSIMKLSHYMLFVSNYECTAKESVDFAVAALHKASLNKQFAPAPQHNFSPT